MERAPDAAQQPKAVAANALERGLMPVRRADPASRFGDDSTSMVCVHGCLAGTHGEHRRSTVEATMFRIRNARARTEDEEFAQWLRHTARNLQRGELPPESWEPRQSPLEDPAVQRRIASLIASIAEKPREKRG
jgi:hypothetical protein